MRNQWTIRVGVLHSLSGTMAEDEKPLCHATQLAVDEINSAGGVLGRRVELVVRDGASDPAIFAERARELLEREGVETIFGCWTSSARKAVKPIVEAHNSLLWYPVQYEGLEESPNIIYTGSCLNQQIDPAVAWALSQGRRCCFLVGSDYVFPRTANRLIRGLVARGKGQVLDEQYAPLGSRDFAGIVDAIADCRPDVVFNTINGDGNHAFFRELQKVLADGSDCPVISFSFSEIGLRETGPAACGHYACWSYFQSVETPENKQFVERYRQRFGPSAVVSDPVVNAYTQVHLWKRIVEESGSCNPQDVLRNVEGRGMEGPGGLMEIQANHHVKKHALIGRANKKGEFDIVWSSERPIEPKPWLGVEDTGLASRSLILEALNQYPEVVNLNTGLEARIRERTDELERLHEELRLTQYLVDHSEQAVFWVTPEGRIHYANNAACRVLGYSKQELLALPFADITEDCADCSAIRHPGSPSFESCYRRKDGSVFLALVNVSRVAYEGREYTSVFATDVTLRRQIEEDLRKSESRFRATFEQAAVGIAHVSPEGRFLRINEKFCDIVGYTREEMLARTFQDITHINDLARDIAHVQSLLEGDADTYAMEKRYWHKRGHIVWVNLTVSLVRGDMGRPRWFVAVVEDVTDRKEAQQRLRESEERLRALASELTMAEERERRRLATVLHDGPAQSLAFARMQLASASKRVNEPVATDKLENVSQTLRQALQQVREVLLDLSSPSLNEIGLGVAISDWLTHQIGERHGMRTSFIDQSGDVPLKDDLRAALFRNTRELLANVVKHSGAGCVSVHMESTGEALEITVEDDGKGVDLDQAFSAGEGRFGLFSIRERMIDLGGALHLQTAAGRGCRATLVMPLERGDSES